MMPPCTHSLNGGFAPSEADTRLRKLSLLWERFTNGILSPRPFSGSEVPHASRRIEAIVRPVSSFELAVMSVGTLDLTNQNIVIDSYDSRDPAKSTLGLYDATKRQENGEAERDDAHDALDGQAIEGRDLSGDEENKKQRED